MCLWLSFYIQAKSGSSHTKDAMEEMNCHLAQTFGQDFPFYLVLAYRMYKWGNDLYSSALLCTHCLLAERNLLCSSLYGFPHRNFKVYQCKQMNSFIKSCIEKMEIMDSQQIAFTFLGFLNRWTFSFQSWYNLIWSETDWCWLTKMLHFTKLAGNHSWLCTFFNSNQNFPIKISSLPTFWLQCCSLLQGASVQYSEYSS